MRMNLASYCNARMCTLQIDCKQLVSLSQPAVSLSQTLCSYYNKKPCMLSILDTWGCMQYLFKSCSAIVTTSFCSVSLTRMHWHLVPQKIKQNYTKNYNALVYNINQKKQSFSQQGFFAKSLNNGLCDSHRWHIYINPQMHSKFKCIRSSPNAIFLATSTARMHLVNNNNPQMHTYAFGD
jgi:hypothetical protein